MKHGYIFFWNTNLQSYCLRSQIGKTVYSFDKWVTNFSIPNTQRLMSHTKIYSITVSSFF
jgi:hypothetical protein